MAAAVSPARTRLLHDGRGFACRLANRYRSRVPKATAPADKRLTSARMPQPKNSPSQSEPRKSKDFWVSERRRRPKATADNALRATTATSLVTELDR